MRRRIKLIAILLIVYLASYLYCRKAFETREGNLVTLYDEDSLIALFAYAIHFPLRNADTTLTGREIKMGNWRDSIRPVLLESLKKEREEALPAITTGLDLNRVQTTLNLIGAKDISDYIGYRTGQFFDLDGSPPEDRPIFESKYYELKDGTVYRLIFRLNPSPTILHTIEKADSAAKLAKKQETWTIVKEIAPPSR